MNTILEKSTALVNPRTKLSVSVKNGTPVKYYLGCH